MPVPQPRFWCNAILLKALDESLDAICGIFKLDRRSPDYTFDDALNRMLRGKLAEEELARAGELPETPITRDFADALEQRRFPKAFIDLEASIRDVLKKDGDCRKIIDGALAAAISAARPNRTHVSVEVAKHLFWLVCRNSKLLAHQLETNGTCWRWIEDRIERLATRFANHCPIFDAGARLLLVGEAWEFERAALRLSAGPRSYGRDDIRKARLTKARALCDDSAIKNQSDEHWTDEQIDRWAPLPEEVRQFIKEMRNPRIARDLHVVAEDNVRKVVERRKYPELYDRVYDRFIDRLTWQAIKNWKSYALDKNGMSISWRPCLFKKGTFLKIAHQELNALLGLSVNDRRRRPTLPVGAAIPDDAGKQGRQIREWVQRMPEPMRSVMVLSLGHKDGNRRDEEDIHELLGLPLEEVQELLHEGGRWLILTAHLRGDDFEKMSAPIRTILQSYLGVGGQTRSVDEIAQELSIARDSVIDAIEEAIEFVLGREGGA